MTVTRRMAELVTDPHAVTPQSVIRTWRAYCVKPVTEASSAKVTVVAPQVPAGDGAGAEAALAERPTQSVVASQVAARISSSRC